MTFTPKIQGQLDAAQRCITAIQNADNVGDVLRLISHARRILQLTEDQITGQAPVAEEQR